MRQPEYPLAARVQAANVLLDRGWGKTPQPHTGEWRCNRQSCGE
jgi:hypothetical protein